MLFNMNQHTILVSMHKSAESTLVVLEAAQLVNSLWHDSRGIANLGMTTIRNGSTEGPGYGGAVGSGGNLVNGGSNVGNTQ